MFCAACVCERESLKSPRKTACESMKVRDWTRKREIGRERELCVLYVKEREEISRIGERQ